MSAYLPNKSRGCGKGYAPPIFSSRENGGAPAQKMRQGSPPWTRWSAEQFRPTVSSIPRLFRLQAGGHEGKRLFYENLSAQTTKNV